MGNFCENFFIHTEYGAVAATAAAIIIFGGIYVAWDYASRALKRKHVLSRSMSIGVLHGGKLSLQRMINYHQARADSQIADRPENDLNSLLDATHPDLWQLRSAVAKLEMSGKEDEAVTTLETALKRARKNQKAHEAYEIEMLLVEMLIYKGDFGKASECKCLEHVQISDARRPLYKAILHILSEHPEDETSKYWKDFEAIRIHFLWQPSVQEDEALDVVVSNFEEFKEVVNLLKNDIQEAREAKKRKKTQK